MYYLSISYNQCRYISSSSLITFVNHACSEDELNIGALAVLSDDDKEEGDDDDEWSDEFNLVIQRHERRYCTMSLALRDIKKGEALKEDYKTFYDSYSTGDLSEIEIKSKETEAWCHGKNETKTLKNVQH